MVNFKKIILASLISLSPPMVYADLTGHFSRANCVTNNESITFTPFDPFYRGVISWHTYKGVTHYAGHEDPTYCSSSPCPTSPSIYEDAICQVSDNCLWPLVRHTVTGRWAAIHSIFGLDAGSRTEWVVEGRHTTLYGYYYGMPVYSIYKSPQVTDCNLSDLKELQEGVKPIFESELRSKYFVQNEKISHPRNDHLISIPDGLTVIPGQPFFLSEQNIKAIKSVKNQIEKLGYVDDSKRAPIADYAIRGMRDLMLYSHGKSNNKLIKTMKVADFNFATVSAGRVNSAILNSNSEAFIMASQGTISRAYSNTKYGNIYINEMPGATMGVIGNADEPNFNVAGAEGYKTTIRYEKGQFSTLLLLRTEIGIILVEIGNKFQGKKANADLEDFISILVTERAR